MSTINSLANMYAQLTGGNGASAQPQKNGSIAGALLDATSQSGSIGDAYTLDLSPQAREYLSSLQNAGNNTLPGKSGFVLSKADQQKISDILTKYKDAPFTQETLKLVEADLDKAGLSTRLLAMKDKAKNFNPTVLLLQAINGDDSQEPQSADELFGTTDQDQEEKSNNFLLDLIKQWKSISTTADDEVPADAVTEVPAGSEA